MPRRIQYPPASRHSFRLASKALAEANSNLDPVVKDESDNLNPDSEPNEDSQSSTLDNAIANSVEELQ